jgi:hypothetical protein
VLQERDGLAVRADQLSQTRNALQEERELVFDALGLAGELTVGPAIDLPVPGG